VVGIRSAAALAARGLDGLLMFQQESMYYLTGYDTFGFCFFQCLYLGVDGRLALLTGSAGLRQARHTSLIEDVLVWTDAQGADPAAQPRNCATCWPMSARAARGWGSRPTPMA
jgi:Xaa-Pro dipeptidase